MRNFKRSFPYRDYTVRGQSNVCCLPKCWPPHRPASVYPRVWCGGRTHSLGGEGWGVNSSEDAKHCSVLYISKYFVVFSSTSRISLRFARRCSTFSTLSSTCWRARWARHTWSRRCRPSSSCSVRASWRPPSSAPPPPPAPGSSSASSPSSPLLSPSRDLPLGTQAHKFIPTVWVYQFCCFSCCCCFCCCCCCWCWCWR